MKPIIMLACLFMALSFVIACDDDDDNDENGKNDESEDDDNADDDNNDNDTESDDDNDASDDDDNDDSDKVWLDESTGLLWQVEYCSPGYVPWHWAMRSCEELVLNGYSDWRLPTISELRSLVQGCDDTATGGACNVTDECLERSCENDACGDACDAYVGPNNGCYGHPALTAECAGFWSSSEVEDDTEMVWYIRYIDGSVRYYYKSSDDGSEYIARCVRNAE